MVKGIIFDFGGVFNNAHESMAGFAAAADRFGHSPQALYDIFYSGPAWQAAKLGRITSGAYWREMMSTLGLDPSGDLHEFRTNLFEGEHINQEVVGIAEQLHQRYPLALLSNAMDDLEWLLEHSFQLQHLFRVVINSAVVGVAKPEPRAYQLALDGLGLQPAEALFIDDKPRNIVAAEQLGVSSILFTSASALAAELRERGLLP